MLSKGNDVFSQFQENNTKWKFIYIYLHIGKSCLATNQASYLIGILYECDGLLHLHIVKALQCLTVKVDNTLLLGVLAQTWLHWLKY